MLKFVKTTRIVIKEEIEVFEGVKPGKPASIAFYFPGENPLALTLVASIPQGLWQTIMPAYVNSDGTPSLDSNLSPIPFVGPPTVTTSDPAIIATVNSDNSIAFQVPDTYVVGDTFNVAVDDASSPALTGTLVATCIGPIAEGVPAGIQFTVFTPTTSQQTVAPAS
jgi:hypothetical protein